MKKILLATTVLAFGTAGAAMGQGQGLGTDNFGQDVSGYGQDNGPGSVGALIGGAENAPDQGQAHSEQGRGDIVQDYIDQFGIGSGAD